SRRRQTISKRECSSVLCSSDLNEPVGSTTTIVAGMYTERGLMPSAKLAGLMAAAIVSDTVMFKSPTSTPRDKQIFQRLAHIAGKIGRASCRARAETYGWRRD